MGTNVIPSMGPHAKSIGKDLSACFAHRHFLLFVDKLCANKGQPVSGDLGLKCIISIKCEEFLRLDESDKLRLVAVSL